jgi:IS30 family transposase
MDEVCRELAVGLTQLGVLCTLTVDNGKEFYGHKELSERLGIPVFFTHPYCSIERGSVENLNGLVRYFLPKRTSFEALTQERLDEIAQLLNGRPRKCLGYLTPFEVQSKDNHLCTLPSVALVG